MIRKEIYLSIILSILLFISIDISSYNHIVLGKEYDDAEVMGKEQEENGEGFEDVSINELFDDNYNNNRDTRNDEVIEKEEEDDDDAVPFILPFNAVPFP
ncbi:MAG: hypothetical protein K0S93_2414 [Nitrososphaeraceae archaeon]|nr:hypothetical protein [Nitrososphaeraceae archaeon]